MRLVPVSIPRTPPSRLQIHDVGPTVDGGRYPVKRTLGDPVVVTCDLVRDGHEQLRAVVRHRPPRTTGFLEEPMSQLGPDHWEGAFDTVALGRHAFQVEAWVDPYASWRSEIGRKLAAGQEDLESELEEGAVLIEDAAGRLRAADRAVVSEAVRALRAPGGVAERAAAATAPAVAEALARSTERRERERSPTYEVDVDRERARFGAWYELFPRSFGGFAGVQEQLPRLAELGFDVVYLPPIHPIGVTHRKGRNNSPAAEPGDPGSPWAIGAEAGGHTAVNPDLGTLAEFESLVMAARENDLEIALDFAIQCSPDHPWLRDHPDWFHRRPDGTLKYAENPPKRYQDIYNLNFDSPDWRGLWQALREALMFWVERGVSIFRVDNPHTKPTAFWEWLIADVREDYPDTIFLAEAFTSPARMYELAKAGFNQSYTYFTWKNSRAELIEYVTELAGPVSEFFRPNFFVNTPDILHAYLQDGGGPPSRRGWCWRPPSRPATGSTPGSRTSRAPPSRPGARSTSTPRSTRSRHARWTGPCSRW